MADEKTEKVEGRLGHARVAVLTIIKEEFDAASEVLGLRSEIRGTEYVTSGESNGRRFDVVLCESTGRSNVASNSRTHAIIEDFRPEVILLVGIAGGMTEEGVGRDGVALGDVVIADFISYTEFLKVSETGLSLRFLPIDHPSVSLRGKLVKPCARRPTLFDAVRVERPDKSTKPKVHEGEIVSGEKVLSGTDADEFQSLLLAPFVKGLAVDMESYGVAQAVCESRNSVWYNPRFLVIRGISDMVGIAGNNETRGKWKSYAAHTASHVAKAFVDRLLEVAPS